MRHLKLNYELTLGHVHVRVEYECATRSRPFYYLQQARWSSKFELIRIANVDPCDVWQLIGYNLWTSDFDD